MSIWLTIFAAGLATYLTRASFIALGDRITLPESGERALRYVAPAAFAAISVPLVLGGDGFAEFGDDLPRIAAACAACAAVWRFKSIALSLIAGMGVLWLLMWLL